MAQTAFTETIRIVDTRRGSAPLGVPRSLLALLLLRGSPSSSSSSSSAGRIASAVVIVVGSLVCSRQEFPSGCFWFGTAHTTETIQCSKNG